MKTFSLAFDLDADMRPVQGQLVFDQEGRITCTQEGVQLNLLDAARCEEATVISGVGCGLLSIKTLDGSEQVLCRFTMSALKPAGEFCKLVNYYIQIGIAAIPDEEEKQVCEKCGRTLVEGMSSCLFCYDRKTLLRKVMAYLRPYAKPLAVAEILLVLSSALYLLPPILSRILIDDFLTPMTGTFAQIALLAALMFVARAVGEVIFVGSSRIFNRASLNFANHLRDAAYEKLQLLSMSSLAKRTPGDLIRRVMEDTTTVKDFLADNGRWAIEQVITFFIVILVLAFTNWKLTLLVLAPIPVVVFFLSRFWRTIHIRYERQWRKNSRANSILHDIIRGIRTVKSFGNEELEIDKFAGASRELAEVMEGNERIWSTLFPAIIFLSGIGEFLVLYFGGKAIVGGALSLGVLVQFTMFIGYIYGPLRWLVSFPRWLADTTTSLVKIFEILDEKPEVAEAAEPQTPALTGGLEFSGVTFGYKSYEPVLKDVNISIRPGEMIGLVGPSGTGKSTLINLVMRLYDPNIGQIRIGGTDIREIAQHHLHEEIGVVFQDTFLFAGTIYDNILYAKPDATPGEVIAACKAANAHEFIMKTADGYHTLVGENGYSISGGERQRIAIARAIIKDPSILILDEATSSLDVETELAIQESLTRLTRGRTTIAIAHRLSTLRSADRLIVMDKGKIAEVGTHTELLQHKGMYFRLVMAQRKTSKMQDGARVG